MSPPAEKLTPQRRRGASIRAGGLTQRERVSPPAQKLTPLREQLTACGQKLTPRCERVNPPFHRVASRPLKQGANAIPNADFTWIT